MGRQERPLRPGPLYEFARDLRRLRVGAGSPPYRLLARKAGYSASALSAAAGGDLLPSLEVVLAYVGALGGDQQDWRQRWQDLAARLRQTDQLAALAPSEPAPQREPGAPRSGAPVPSGEASRNASKTGRRVAHARLAAAPMILLAGIIAALTILNTGGRSLPELGPDPAIPPSQGTNAPATAGAAPQTGISAAPSIDPDGAPGSSTSAIRAATGTGAQVQTVKFGFDDGTTQTWGPFWNGNNITATVTNQTVYGGTYALRLQANTHYDRPPAIGTTHLAGLTAGATVTFLLWYGGQGSGTILPFVEDNAGVRWAPQTFALPASTGWHTFTWTVPNTTPHALGIQFNTTNTADVVVTLDSVNWTSR